MIRDIKLPGLPDDDQRTLSALVEQLNVKTTRNMLRQAYYDMKHLQRLVGSVIPPNYQRIGIVLGWSGKAVDTLARRCNLDEFVWPDGDLKSLGSREVWTGNSLGTEVSQAMTSAFIHSTAFIVNTTGDADTAARGLIHFKDALNATGSWDGRARRMSSLLSITGRDAQGDPTSIALYLPGRTYTAARDGSQWVITSAQSHPWGVPAEPLPYKPRLGRPFGSSRISRAVMSLQDSATRTAIRLEAHGDIYAIPDLWLFGADASIFQHADGTQKAAFEVMMGRLKAIPDDEDAPSDALARASVTQLPSHSPQPHLDQLKQQAQLFSGETAIPLTSLGVSDMSNPTSADSYIASREDLIAEAEGATDAFRPYLDRAFIRALTIQNGLRETPAEWSTITGKFRSPVYLSKAQAADAGAKQLGAVPWLAETEVGLELLGLTDQQRERALAERRRAEGRAVLEALAASPAGDETTAGRAEDAASLKAKADAMGVLIRSGVDPQVAAERVGWTGLTFTGAVPVSLRMPEADAAGLED